MKSTGILRKVDELGRIVIPIELRRTLEIAEKDPLEIYVNEDKIILQKHRENMTCVVTGDETDQNQSFSNGRIVLSPNGAKQLLNEIKEAFNL
ncbi:AbrB/MazE/SpoVT family DNA-binding domain-containing protein [Bacillus sp. T3]|uniref:AbrB/MazE/SpoVT family DNA-binding domain-containing protein n=1 Tax=Bacillus sp. T3 TaxID=467262 RepID=UPI0029828F17|nr:AbrB/MazE/SpoVT family DNA-binding domain-containing protein [Bacillus sp. T3]